MPAGPNPLSTYIVGISQYAPPWGDRPTLATAATRFARVLDKSSAIKHHGVDVGGPSSYSIKESLRKWGDSPEGTVGLLLWTSHAKAHGGNKAALISGKGDGSLPILPSEVGLAMSTGQGITSWIAFIDCCYAERVSNELAASLDENQPYGSYSIVASSSALELSESGIFTAAVADLLDTVGIERNFWTRRERAIPWERFHPRLKEYLEEPPRRIETYRKERVTHDGLPFLPNPHYQPSSIAGSFDEAHFLPKANGVEAGQTGWYFTGRTEPMQTLIDWVANGRGLLPVIGSAGTGKSAILGRLITLSHRPYRDIATEAGVLQQSAAGTVPPTGCVDLAFHARERTTTNLLEVLADYFDLENVKAVADLHSALDRLDTFTLVIDALDEAVFGHSEMMLKSVLLPMSRRDCRIVVGSRTSIGRDAAAWQQLGPEVARPIDLDDQPSTFADIRAYADRRLRLLPASTYAECKQSYLDLVASAIAEHATDQGIGSFLVARVITATISRQTRLSVGVDGWKDKLPVGLHDAFEADLASYGVAHGHSIEQAVRDLLESIAWEEGRGIPRSLIPIFAHAVSGKEYDDDDVITLLNVAGGHISEIDIDGWAHYRIYHERLREHLREQTRKRLDDYAR